MGPRRSEKPEKAKKAKLEDRKGGPQKTRFGPDLGGDSRKLPKIDVAKNGGEKIGGGKIGPFSTPRGRTWKNPFFGTRFSEDGNLPGTDRFTGRKGLRGRPGGGPKKRAVAKCARAGGSDWNFFQNRLLRKMRPNRSVSGGLARKKWTS